MTDLIRRKQPGEAWETAVDTGGGGGSQPGAAQWIGPFPFAFDDVGLAAGIEFYTTSVGELLLDALVFVPVAFDGTTPKFDFGISGDSTGFFYGQNDAAPLDHIDGGNSNYSYVWNPSQQMSLASFIYNASDLTALVTAVLKFKLAATLSLYASQDGSAGGTPIGGTVGEGELYLLVASAPETP